MDSMDHNLPRYETTTEAAPAERQLSSPPELELFDSKGTLKTPEHVAIIMDGNGRWAKKRGWHRSIGHAKGSSRVKDIVREADRLGVKILTLYCFSTENWNRSEEEVSTLMMLLKDYLLKEKETLVENNIRLSTFGQTERIPAQVREVLKETIEATSKNTGLSLNFCISYGGRAEMIRATQRICEKYKNGEIELSEVDEALFSDHLYTAGLPDPDLMIRTSGESRISNFLLWQLAYSELYITDTPWPEFTPEKLREALTEFSTRKRRFGRSDEVSPT